MHTLWRYVVTTFIIGISIAGGSVMAQNTPVKNIVLVHGAFADGSSWSKVIPLLQSKGFNVTSVGIPLTSFEDDVAATKRAIGAEDGPVILVGHSYGGLVITEAGNDPKVVGLVYVAAFAPGTNQTITEISEPFPPHLGLTKLTPLPDGFLLLSPDGIGTAFAQDLTKEEQSLLIAVQPQTAGAIFGAKPTAAAWHAQQTLVVHRGKQ
jgi:pimeloyl-ACP methyl ester carboxylesterase